MKLLQLLFPIQCIGCKAPGEYLCARCKKTLQPHPDMCPVSHRFSQDFEVHIDHRGEVAYGGIIIGFSYNNLLKKLILALKYYHRYHICSFLVDRLSLIIQTNQTIQRMIKAKNVIVTSIPAHRYRKYCVKGYNQSELLAKGIAQKFGYSHLPLLRKTKHTRIQAFLSREKRMKNLEGVFTINPDIALHGDELILIVDDITTTGSTVNAAAKALKILYPQLTIWGAVIGRHS